MADPLSMSESSSDYPLASLMKAWREKISRAEKVKKKLFGDTAEELMKFYECGKDLNDVMWGAQNKTTNNGEPDVEELPAPRFRMIVGKVAEFVALYGPSLYHRNPTIVVEPKVPNIPTDMLIPLVDPMLMQQAVQAAQQQGQEFNPENLFPPDPKEAQSKVVSALLQYMLDYLQRENDKKSHSQQTIDEALVKGAGIAFTTILQNHDNGSKLAGSIYRSIDDFVIDPDATTWEEVQWIGIKWTQPVWEVAEDFNQDEDYLMKKYGTLESIDQQESVKEDPLGKDKQRKGITNDLITYWEVFSKMGMGHRLSGLRTQHNPHGFMSEEATELLDYFGKYCRIVVADKVPYPLNLDNDLLLEILTKPEEEEDSEVEAEELQEDDPIREQLFVSSQWPIPFWADGEWPTTMLGFRFIPGTIWPGPCIKPALGYLKFLNWTMSFMANRIRHSCRTVVSVMKSMEEEVRQRLLSGKDFEILDIPNALIPDGDVGKSAHFFQIPDVPGEVWKIVEWVSNEFDKASGLTELMYASPGGMRSAAEANVKGASMQIRPDDMASKVEDWASLVARKEAIALHWLDSEDIALVLGERCSALWEQFVRSMPFEAIFREYNYRIEAGSTRKPNKDTQVAQINAAIQSWMPMLQLSLQNGNVRPINWMMQKWADANNFEMKEALLTPPPPPPPNPMQMKIEAEIEGKKQELALKGQEMQMKAQMSQAELQLKAQSEQANLQMKAQETGMKLQGEQAKMQLDAAQTQQQMELERQKAMQGLQVEGMKAAVGMKQEQMKMMQGSLQMAHDARLKTVQAAMDMKLKKQQMNQKAKQKSTNGAAK